MYLDLSCTISYNVIIEYNTSKIPIYGSRFRAAMSTSVTSHPAALLQCLNTLGSQVVSQVEGILAIFQHNGRRSCCSLQNHMQLLRIWGMYDFANMGMFHDVPAHVDLCRFLQSRNKEPPFFNVTIVTMTILWGDHHLCGFI